MAKRCSDGLLFKAIELANTCDLNYRASRNKRLLLELTLIQLCQLSSAGQPADDKKKGLIEPIASNGPGQAPAQSGQVVTAQQTYTVQSAPPLQRPVQSPQEMTGATPRQQVVSTHVPPSPTLIPQAPPASAPKRVARPPQFGTSIKEIGVEHPKAQATTQAATVVQEMQSPFSQEALVHYWDAYASAIDKKVYLKNTMINCKPVLQDNYYFEVCVHNPGQQDELTNNCIDILSYLRMQLKNTRIQMRVRIDETNQKHLAYTSAEKYEHLLNINPVLAKLKDEFNLTLD
jgi:DNA polymerase-3 subunit gamma/tau